MSEAVNIVYSSEQREGTTSVLANWLKQTGDSVTAHEPVAEIETDKVIVEIAAPADGVLAEIIKSVGEDVGPGELLGVIEPAAAIGSTTAKPEEGAAKQSVEAIQPAEENTPLNRNHTLSPVVRKLIRQHDLDPSLIEGTGRKGRVTKLDVENFLQNLSTVKTERPPCFEKECFEKEFFEKEPVEKKPAVKTPLDESSSQVVVKNTDNGIPGYSVPHNAMRKRIAEHMVESLLKTAPHVTSIFEVDMSAVIAHRNAHKTQYQSKGVNLTFSAYFIMAAVEALQTVPEINSRFYEDHLQVFSDINIGVGTALGDKGLVVPVLHQAQNHNLLGIAGKLQDMTERARNGKLAPEDMRDGTFTISNHGVSGSLVATPIIINQPQSAILGVGKLEKRVVVKEVDGQDTIAIRPMCYVSLSIDHRSLDAYQCNLFLSRLVDVLDNWK